MRFTRCTAIERLSSDTSYQACFTKYIFFYKNIDSHEVGALLVVILPGNAVES